METLNGPFGLAADLPAYVPSSEAGVLLPVHLPYLIDHVFVVFYLLRQVSCVPVFA